MKKIIFLIIGLTMTACGPGFHVKNYENPEPENITYFPVASATINVASYGSLSFMKRKPSFMDLLIPQAIAQVAQGSATVTVIYNNPSATVFTVNTASLGNSVTVSGDDLNLGSLSISGLDDNSLRVCTGAPQSRCNKLYIRIFTLGTASGGITGTAGFINTAGLYGIDVFAGSVTTPIGFNASATAGTVTNAATVYEFNINNGTNRVRLSQLSIPVIPIKASLANAGNGPYEMNLVVQYALAYVP